MRKFLPLLLVALFGSLLLPVLNLSKSLAQGPVTNTCATGEVARSQLVGNFSTARTSPKVTASSGYLYVLGGSDGLNAIDSVEFAPIDALGNLGAWQATTPISTSRLSFATASTDKFVYTVGGYHQGTLDIVEFASVQEDGTLGAWQTTTPLKTARSEGAVFIFDGYLYILGSFGTAAERAIIHEDGTLGAWEDVQGAGLPRNVFGFAIFDNHIYAIGGQVNGVFSATVERTTINPDGSLGPWEPATSMGVARAGLGAVSHGDYIYAIGGSSYIGNPGVPPAFDVIERAKRNPDGSLGGWEVVNALATPRRELAVIALGNYIYTLGGTNTSFSQNPVPLKSIERWNATLPLLPDEYGLTLNDGALFTNQVTVTLTIGQKSPWKSQVQVSNDGGFAGAVWQSYITCKPWQITQYGNSIIPRTVYVRYKDSQGNISATFQDDIILDVTAPVGTVEVEEGGSGGSLTSGDNLTSLDTLPRKIYLPVLIHQPNLTLRLAATDDLSGVASMLISNNASFVGATWESYKPTRLWFAGNEVTTVYIKFKDHAGNVSGVVKGKIN